MERSKQWVIGFLFLAVQAVGAWADPSVALFYGANPPFDELKAFDVVVVDPDHPGVNPKNYQRSDSELFAYVSVGEVTEDRAYFRKIPAAWLPGKNKGWGSRVIDQSRPEWPAFFVDQVIAPLWAKGYRGFFFDTMDSYQLIAKSPDARAKQEAGLKAVIRAVKKRWPEVRIILNRGFEVLPDVHQDVWMVAAESLYRGWDAERNSYVDVTEEDRNWLLGQLRKVRDSYHLPVLVIDYVPAEQRQTARDTAAKIRDAGFIPYVTTPNLDTMGVGQVEVLPRKVLVIYSAKDAEDIHYSDAQRYLGMPLAYLGFVPDYRAVNQPLPDYQLTGRYAGVVSWLNDDEAGRGVYASWLERQVRAGIPLAVFSRFGIGTEPTAFDRLGLRYTDAPVAKQLSIVASDPMMGFELPLEPRSTGLSPLTLTGKGRPLLTLKDADNQRYTPAAITPWGGYVLYPYTVGALSAIDGSERWYINPLTFLKAALRVDTSVPVPDVTTDMGRRLLMVHIDGDGFANKAERRGYPFAGQVMLDDVIKRYPVPTSLSIIEGEVGPTGLYPKDSPKMEAIARQLFALPWVELATHTYSHPFHWAALQLHSGQKMNETAEGGDSLPIPGYQFSVQREIGGSSSYINQNLASGGKRVKILFWSGDCVATPEALKEAYDEGLLNMNGGDTIITRSHNSWTNIAGLGISKGGYFQIFAPDENENVYTNLWRGPFYGYERVIETFELTEAPYRFKPIDIYFHFYAVTKAASLRALLKVYDWALRQPVHPVYVSDYLRKVLDYNSFVVARTPNGYRLRGLGALRTVRLPATGLEIDYEHSPAIAGAAPGPNARYVSLAGGSADLVLKSSSATQPFIEFANARLTHFERSARGIDFALQGYQPVRFTLGNAGSCHLKQGAAMLMPSQHQGNLLSYEMSSNDSSALRLDCGA